MEKLIYTNEINIHSNFKAYNVMFIDIETDGLSHNNKIAIIGLIIYTKSKDKPEVIQLFNEDYHSEKDLLLELINLIQIHYIDYYVSFNGNSFDFPFINARLMHYKIKYKLCKGANIDLYRLVKSNQSFLDLPDAKLKTVEKYVGIDRTDTISGKDSIILYEAFLETKSPILKKSILLHNYDDIVNMIPLLKLFDSIDYIPPFYFEYHKSKFYLSSYKIKGNFLLCEIVLNEPYSLKDLYFTANGASLEYSDTTLTLKLELAKSGDARGNMYMFFNSVMLYNKNFDYCNDDEKHSLLAAYNQTCIEDTIKSYLKFVIVKILDILGESKF